MRDSHTCIGICAFIHNCLCRLFVGLAYQKSRVGYACVQTRAMLNLPSYRSYLARWVGSRRSVATDVLRVALFDEQSIAKRPDWPAEGGHLSALLGIKKAGRHVPPVISQPW